MKALAMSTDGKGRYGALDPYLGAMHAVAEAARNVATTGARGVRPPRREPAGGDMSRHAHHAEGDADAPCDQGCPDRPDERQDPGGANRPHDASRLARAETDPRHGRR